ncbi:hypothetical protein PhCBS80983_g00329 [Powellomyces hirtus]|uniref:Cytochrome c oxidase assembly protein COX16, mitochondrial n=1 Tax=Powellomyces hirtus TaxID=109895 RepID=A0A507EFS2_9FUNG|nr:hypothetical protein PhCBS80983_g00329 [Powellomyces hirtus]
MTIFKRGKSSIFTIGLPFFGAMIMGTYGMAHLAQTRYDYHDTKTKLLAKKEQLKIEKDRRPFNVQEEYWKLTSTKQDWDDWDMVRVQRPAGEE